MSLIGAFLNQTAVIRPYVRFGGGQMIYGEREERDCRLQLGFKTKVVYKNPAGSIVETVSNALMFVEGDRIPVNSEVTCEEQTMRVIQCEPMRGLGPSHMEVLLE
ncbi:MAG: hypothetical protein IKK34_08055 [Clostridia bacterium]|nr:hypothetical protein [Clostridia bacterium]